MNSTSIRPPAVVLEVEQLALVGVGVAHLLAHRQHLARSLARSRRWHSTSLRMASNCAPTSASPARVAGAGEGLVLPHPGRFHLVLAEGRHRTHQQSGIAVRAQAQVGLEQHAGRGAAGEPGVEALRQARIDFRRLRRVVVEQEHDVEVGGVAQFLAAQLAVADDGEVRFVAVALAQLAPGEAQREVDHDVGQFGQMVGQVFRP